MTIEEAITYLRTIKHLGEVKGDRYDSKALQLGIEALKWIKQARQHDLYVKPERLHGETEE